MPRTQPMTLAQFLDHFKAARRFLRNEARRDDDAPVDAAWRGHTAALHGACAEMIGRDEKRQHFPRLAFDHKDMRDDEARLSDVETAERTIEEILADLRAEKEGIKGRMARRSGLAMQVVDTKLADPLADRAETDDLKVLSAKPRAIVSAYNDGVAAARRKTESLKDDTTSLAADRDRLRLENKVLRGGALSVDDVAAAPAPRRARRTRRG